jgi:hypothetical protein
MVGHCQVPNTNAGGFTTTPLPEHLAYQDYAIRLIKLTLAVLVVFNKLFYCTDTNPAIAVGNILAIPLVLAMVVSIATQTVSTCRGKTLKSSHM